MVQYPPELYFYEVKFFPAVKLAEMDIVDLKIGYAAHFVDEPLRTDSLDFSFESVLFRNCHLSPTTIGDMDALLTRHVFVILDQVAKKDSYDDVFVGIEEILFPFGQATIPLRKITSSDYGTPKPFDVTVTREGMIMGKLQGMHVCRPQSVQPVTAPPPNQQT